MSGCTGLLLTACPGTGQYNENAFRALDQIIAAADKAGVKLILTITDNWTKGADGLAGVCAVKVMSATNSFICACICVTAQTACCSCYMTYTQLFLECTLLHIRDTW